MLVVSPIAGFDKMGPPRVISEIPKRQEVNPKKETVSPKISGDLLVICSNERRWWPRKVIIRGGQLLVGSAHNEEASPSLKIPLRHLSLRAGPLPNSLSLIKGTTIVLTLQTASQRTFDLWVKTIAIELIRQTPLDAVKYLDILTLKDCWDRNYYDEPKDFNFNIPRRSIDRCNECRINQNEEFANLTYTNKAPLIAKDVKPKDEVDSRICTQNGKDNIDSSISTKIKDKMEQTEQQQRKRNRNGSSFYGNGFSSLGRERVKITYSTGNIRETYNGNDFIQSPTNKIIKVSEDFRPSQEPTERTTVYDSKTINNNSSNFDRKPSTNRSFRKRCEEFQKLIENQKLADEIKVAERNKKNKEENCICKTNKTNSMDCLNCLNTKDKVLYDINRNRLKSPSESDSSECNDDVVHTVEVLFKKCQSSDNYVPVREKLVLFESLSRLGRVRSTEDVFVKVNVGTKRARSLYDLSNCIINSTGVREICRYFEKKTDSDCKQTNNNSKHEKSFLKNAPSLELTTIRFNRNLHNVSYA